MLQRLVWRLMRVKALVAITRGSEQYASNIAGFEAAPVVDGAVVFFGSSSLRLWSTLKHDMDPLPVVNAGFGGGHAIHLNLFWRRVLPRHHPRAVVVYVGDNDLASGVSVDDVACDVGDFIAEVKGLCPVVLLLVKRSPQRAHLDVDIDALNARYRAFASDRVVVVDVDAVLRGAGGAPDRALFQWDGLHLNAAGYAKWTAALKPVLLALPK